MPRRTVLAPLLSAAAAVIGPPAAAAQDPCAVTRTGAPAHRPGTPRPPLLVGDSSSLLAVAPLVRLGIEADARGCRQTAPAVDILAARKRAGTLPRVVVLAIGANGSVSAAELRRALRIAGPRRRLGLVTTPRPYANAQAMRAFAARHRAGTILIDWAGSGIPGRYGGDGLHIGYAGEAELARFVAAHLRPYMPPRPAIALPADPAAAKACDTVVRRGRTVAVLVVRGRDRILCSIARRLATSPRPAALANWRWFDWSFAGRPPWTDVFERRDGRVVVALRPPVRAPAAGTRRPGSSGG